MAELFLQIVNMSISASWLVLAVVILRFLLKKAPKWVNVLLWGLVAFRLICPFTLESALSLIPSAETISPEIMMDTAPTINSGIEAVNRVVNPVITDTFAPEPIASANPLQIWIPVLALIWCTGMGAMALYTLFSYWQLRYQVRTAVRAEDNVYLSEHVASPFVLGIVRPRIYLPYRMEELDRLHVLAHEQAHIRRKDHWWKPLGFLLLTIYWFNPIMWIAYILLCRDIELACDERVIKELGADQRADYSQALLHCSIPHRSIAACPIAFGEVGVKERVKNVLRYKKPAFWMVLIAVLLCIVVAVCFLTDPAQEDSPDSAWGLTATARYVSTTQMDVRFDHTNVSPEVELASEYKFRLQTLADGQWTDVSPKAGTQTSIECFVAPPNSDQKSWAFVDWSASHGELSSGTYRLAMDIYRVESEDPVPHTLYIEFTIGGSAEPHVIFTLDDISPTGLTVYIQEDVDSFDYAVVEDFRLEVWQNGQWTAMEPTVPIEAPLMTADRNIHTLYYSSEHAELDWSMLYGQLPAGLYRLVQDYSFIKGADASIRTACAEFDISSGSDWGIDLVVDKIGDNGITVDFLFSDTIAEDAFFFTGATLQVFNFGRWEDLLPMPEPSAVQEALPEMPGIHISGIGELTGNQCRVGIRVQHLLPGGEEESYTFYEYFDPANYAWGVTLDSKDVSPIGLTALVTCPNIPLTAEELTCNTSYRLQKRENNQWVEMEPSSGELPNLPEANDPLIPGKTGTDTHDWMSYYGALPDGDYRIAKDITRHYDNGEMQTRTIYAVFTVASNANT